MMQQGRRPTFHRTQPLQSSGRTEGPLYLVKALREPVNIRFFYVVRRGEANSTRNSAATANSDLVSRPQGRFEFTDGNWRNTHRYDCATKLPISGYVFRAALFHL